MDFSFFFSLKSFKIPTICSVTATMRQILQLSVHVRHGCKNVIGCCHHAYPHLFIKATTTGSQLPFISVRNTSARGETSLDFPAIRTFFLKYSVFLKRNALHLSEFDFASTLKTSKQPDSSNKLLLTLELNCAL